MEKNSRKRGRWVNTTTAAEKNPKCVQKKAKFPLCAQAAGEMTEKSTHNNNKTFFFGDFHLRIEKNTTFRCAHMSPHEKNEQFESYNANKLMHLAGAHKRNSECGVNLTSSTRAEEAMDTEKINWRIFFCVWLLAKRKERQ